MIQGLFNFKIIGNSLAYFGKKMQKKNNVETVQDGTFGANEKYKIHDCIRNREAKLPPIEKVRSDPRQNPKNL